MRWEIASVAGAILLSNFAWHALQGHFSMKVVQKLDKVFRIVDNICFDPRKDVIAVCAVFGLSALASQSSYQRR